MPTMNLTQFAYAAARDLGSIRTGYGLQADLLNDILGAANLMLDSWLLEELYVSFYGPSTFTLPGNKNIFTIGPTGADFTAPRPTQIEDANIILTNVNPVVRVPLNIVNVDTWSSIAYQSVPNSIPTVLYYEKSFDPALGYSRLFLWGQSYPGYQLELYTWDQNILRQFSDLTTSYSYPPGYARLIQKGLACEIAPLMNMYCQASRTDELMMPTASALAIVKQQFDEAKSTVQGYNAPNPILVSDPAFQGGDARRAWNYFTGTYGRSGR
jgi:hypothetical protein